MALSTEYTTLFLDLGDVLFDWCRESKTSISPSRLEKIVSSNTYQEYECGRLTQKQCYELIAQDFALDVTEIASAISQVRESLHANHKMTSAIRQLKTESNGSLRVYAMSNISLPDYEYLRTVPADWEIFDDIFISGAVGQRKPHPSFYEFVLKATNSKPQNTIFVDDRVENVLSAQRLGIHGILFSDSILIVRTLRNLVGDPVKRGQAFLTRNAKNFVSETDGGISIKENFSRLLILEATNNKDLVSITIPARKWNFFIGKAVLTTSSYPDDLDTTALGTLITQRDTPTSHSIMDEMLEYVNADGIIQVYYDNTRPRIDAVVTTNVLALFYAHSRGHQLRSTLQYVLSVLQSRSYLTELRYYASPECLLFFLCRLLQLSDDPALHSTLKPLLKEHIRERIGLDADALALAMRVDVCAKLEIKNEVDTENLLALQEEDGSWGVGWVYKYGSSGTRIGNRGVTTALAVNAIKGMRELQSQTEGEEQGQMENETKIHTESPASGSDAVVSML